MPIRMNDAQFQQMMTGVFETLEKHKKEIAQLKAQNPDMVTQDVPVARAMPSAQAVPVYGGRRTRRGRRKKGGVHLKQVHNIIQPLKNEIMNLKSKIADLNNSVYDIKQHSGIGGRRKKRTRRRRKSRRKSKGRKRRKSRRKRKR